MNIIYSFVWKRQENMSDIVSVHWQQGKFQLYANCFMSWHPVSNAGLGISKTPSAAHWCVQRPKYSVMSRIGTSFNTRIHIYEVWVYSSVPWHSYGNITSPLVSIRPSTGPPGGALGQVSYGGVQLWGPNPYPILGKAGLRKHTLF